MTKTIVNNGPNNVYIGLVDKEGRQVPKYELVPGATIILDDAEFLWTYEGKADVRVVETK